MRKNAEASAVCLGRGPSSHGGEGLGLAGALGRDGDDQSPSTKLQLPSQPPQCDRRFLDPGVSFCALPVL